MTCESISLQMSDEEVDFMLADLNTKLAHQTEVVAELLVKSRNVALLLQGAKHRLDKIKTDIEVFQVMQKQSEMGVEDDQWLLDAPVYLSTIQKMRLKYASLLEAAKRL